MAKEAADYIGLFHNWMSLWVLPLISFVTQCLLKVPFPKK